MTYELITVRTEGRIDQQIKNTEALVSATLYDERDQECVRATGRFALLSAKMMRRMKIMNAQTIADFEQMVIRTTPGGVPVHRCSGRRCARPRARSPGLAPGCSAETDCPGRAERSEAQRPRSRRWCSASAGRLGQSALPP